MTLIWNPTTTCLTGHSSVFRHRAYVWRPFSIMVWTLTGPGMYANSGSDGMIG